MKASYHTSTGVVGFVLLAGLWAAACAKGSDKVIAAGGAVKTGGSTSSSTSPGTGGTTGTNPAQTGGATSPSTGGATGTNPAQTGGATSTGTATAGGGATSSGGTSPSGGVPSGGSTAAGGSGVGGTTSQTGGSTSAGGASSTGGTTTATTGACSLTTGLVDGCQAAPKPAVFALSDTCTIGLWAGDTASGGGFYAPWCTGTTATTTDAGVPCTLTLACAAGAMHVSGSYSGSGGGNAGFGTYLQTYSDAGMGCPKMDITSFTGVTIDINATTVPSNSIYFGLSLGDGNSAEKTITTVAGTQSLKIPFASMTNKNKCGSVTGPGVAGIYISFAWFNDAASHPVDVTFSNIGFY